MLVLISVPLYFKIFTRLVYLKCVNYLKHRENWNLYIKNELLPFKDKPFVAAICKAV